MTNSYEKAIVLRCSNESRQKANFGLERAEFDRLVLCIQQGDESFLDKVFREQLELSISFLQKKFGIHRSEAYDICMDTLLVFRTKLKNGKLAYGNLRYLYTRMASNKYIDHKKGSQRLIYAVRHHYQANTGSEQVDSHLITILKEALIELKTPQQKFIEKIYFSEHKREDLLHEYGLSASAFRKRKQRALEKLRGKFMEVMKRKNTVLFERGRLL